MDNNKIVFPIQFPLCLCTSLRAKGTRNGRKRVEVNCLRSHVPSTGRWCFMLHHALPSSIHFYFLSTWCFLQLVSMTLHFSTFFPLSLFHRVQNVFVVITEIINRHNLRLKCERKAWTETDNRRRLRYWRGFDEDFLGFVGKES